jgi:hypothetical protein
MRHPSLEELQTSRLIADIRRVVDILKVDIAEEETRCGVSDPRKAEYPMRARALVARRDNLEATIASLQQRVGGERGA